MSATDRFRYRVGCAGMFLLGQDYGMEDEDDAIVACEAGPMGCEVYDTITRKWIGPTCQEDIDEAKVRLANGCVPPMPDREYPAGALEATVAGLMPSRELTGNVSREAIAHHDARAALDAVADMDTEDRAALARWVWPEGWEGRELTRHECLTCGSLIESFSTSKSAGTVMVIGCRNGCGFILDREGRRRPANEVSRLTVYREFGGGPDAVK